MKKISLHFSTRYIENLKKKASMIMRGLYRIAQKHQLSVGAFLITLFLLLVVHLLDIAVTENKFLNPFEQAFRDFQYTDILYSQIKVNHEFIDTNIVLVRIDDLNRDGIADLIEHLRTFQPAVIGLDIIFSNTVDTIGTSHLNKALQENQNLVIAENLIYAEDGSAIRDPNSSLFGVQTTGHINLPGEHPRSATIREFQPFILTSDGLIPSFAGSIVRLYSPTDWEKLTLRNNQMEIINYSGSLNAFPVLTAKEILSKKKGLQGTIKGKIVLIGHFKPEQDLNSVEDKYFTPFNEEITGRSWPDMYGIVIHANIISMILRGSYIDQLSKQTEWMIAFLVCYFYLLFFMYLFKKNEFWYHPISKLVQFISIILILYLIFLIYSFGSLKIDSTLLIVLLLLTAGSPDIYCFAMVWIRRFFARKKS